MNDPVFDYARLRGKIKEVLAPRTLLQTRLD